jgi:hypothetical protein
MLNEVRPVKMFAAVLVCLLSAGDPSFAQQTSEIKATAAKPEQPTSSIPSKPTEPPTPNTLLDGTAVKLRLKEELSSASAKTGQQVAFEVVEEVDVQGVAVLAKGGTALATITTAEPRKRLGRGGKLDVYVDSARLIDGEKVQLRAMKDTHGGGHIGVMTTAMVATSIVFFPAAPLFLFMHGKEVVIPKGTEITAFVQGDMKLDMTKMVAPGSPVVTAAASGVEMASLAVSSNVPSADIEVDGAFVGNTPSTVSVSQGKHTITVKKKGYADWSRSMNVSGNGVRLNAELEAKP